MGEGDDSIGRGRLFVAEKPSVARAIAEQLGGGRKHEGYLQCRADRITWCFGHMLELAEPDHYLPADIPRTPKGRKVWRVQDLPIVPKRWKLLPRKEARKQLQVLGQLLKEASLVVNAGDPDREGQLLVDEVLEHFRFRGPVLRFWVSAQDATSVARGLAALQSNVNYQGLAQAARARQRADWLIGMNLSRAYTLRARALGAGALLTVGRVQTPTLALVVKRDREIAGFVAKDYFPVHAKFIHAAGAFSAVFQPPDDMPGLDEEGRIKTRAVADAVAKRVQGRPGVIRLLKREQKTVGQPLLHTLSTLTQEASRRFGLSAEQVLRGAQALYEVHKLTSYPRTDCGYMPTSQHADASAVLAAIVHARPDLRALVTSVDPRMRSRSWDDGKVTAHHGIVPTMHRGDAGRLNDVEAKLYNLVARRYLAQFLPPHRSMATRAEVLVAEDLFVATGTTPIDMGWKAAEETFRSASERTQDNRELPAMKEGDAVTCERAEPKNEKTKPPPPFTEGTLIAAMERIHAYVENSEHKKLLKDGDGIGTPATRATILSELRRRDFLTAKGKFIESTALGRGLIDALPESVRSPGLTALYERALRQVEQGEHALDAFVEGQVRFLRERLSESMTAQVHLSAPAPTGASTKTKTTRASSGAGGAACPVCGKPLVERSRKSDGAPFWGCSGFPACRHTAPAPAGRKRAPSKTRSAPAAGARRARASRRK